MPRDWFKYWRPRQIRSVLSNEGRLHHVPSDQLTRVDLGDTIWVVGANPRRELVTVGYMVVKEKISLGYEVRNTAWQGDKPSTHRSRHPIRDRRK